MPQRTILHDSRIMIVGLGLMGGSMAKALRKAGHEIMAVDINPDILNEAVAMDVIAYATTDFDKGVTFADILILATPVRTILESLRALPAAKPEGCIVIDLGSTKGQICEAMSELPNQFQAIGAHPMCGRERSGYSASNQDLFENQPFVFCRTSRTTDRAIEAALAICAASRGLPLFLEPDVHDEIVALTSHVPYLLAATLASSVAEKAMEDPRYWEISATGLRDTSRLAGSDPVMMQDIISTNKRAILKHLRSLIGNLGHLLAEIEDGNSDMLNHRLQAARDNHGNYTRNRWQETSQGRPSDIKE